MEKVSVVNRQKSALAEELINARRELEKHSEAVLRLAKAKEELTKEKAELAVEITACERENRQQGEASITPYPRRLCRSSWIGFLSSSVCLSVCPQHRLTQKTNEPKVFKLGVGNDLGIP